jgi:hypothetical protein
MLECNFLLCVLRDNNFVSFIDRLLSGKLILRYIELLNTLGM